WPESKGARAMRNGDHNLWKGVVAGAAGGLAASWVMNQFQAAWSKAQAKLENDQPRSHQRESNGEEATMKAGPSDRLRLWGTQGRCLQSSRGDCAARKVRCRSSLRGGSIS